MTISDYTVIYECSGIRREWYLKARNLEHARLSAEELIPSSCSIKKVYHDPSWS